MAYTEAIIDGRKVILDENGKPCRTCNSLEDFQSANLFLKGVGGAGSAYGIASSSSSSGLFEGLSSGSKKTVESASIKQNEALEPVPEEYRDEPPDSGELGRGTWTMLHSMAAHFPVEPTPAQEADFKTFLTGFTKFYPCRPCAEGFERWKSKHEPETESQEKLSIWMCNAHNVVNARHGKPLFDCRDWRNRWRDGWD